MSDHVESLRQQLDENAKDLLRLIETVKYLRGIAVRGLGYDQPEDQTVEQFVLGYVKGVEYQLNSRDAEVEELRRQLTEAQSEVEQAFREGFRSVATYNDTVVNDEDTEWEKYQRVKGK